MEKIAFKRWKRNHINQSVINQCGWWKETSDDQYSYVGLQPLSPAHKMSNEYYVWFSGSIITWAKAFPYPSFDGYGGLCYFSNDQIAKQCINKFLKKMVKLQVFS